MACEKKNRGQGQSKGCKKVKTALKLFNQPEANQLSVASSFFFPLMLCLLNANNRVIMFCLSSRDKMLCGGRAAQLLLCKGHVARPPNNDRPYRQQHAQLP